MIKQAKSWLPPSALTRADEEALVRTVAGHWAQAWFAGVQSLRVSRLPEQGAGQLIWRQAGEAWLGYEEQEAAKLGMALCGGRADQANPRDRLVLTALAAEACEDLALRFSPEGAVPDAAPRAPAGQQVRSSYQVHPTSRQWSLRLLLGHDAVIGTRRRLACSNRLPELGSLDEALRETPCKLSVRLGQARLSAAELATLDPGDVVMLDQALAEPLPLTVAGAPFARNRARFDPQGDQLRFSIAGPDNT